MRRADRQHTTGRRAWRRVAIVQSHRLAANSVANVSQVVTLNRDAFLERAGKIGRAKLELIFSGLGTILDRRG